MKKRKIVGTILVLILCLGIATQALAVGDYKVEWEHMPQQKAGSGNYQTKPTKAIQHYMLYWNLESHDYIYNGGGMDGVFGSATTNAVKSFQRSRGMSLIDGVVGIATWRAMYLNLTYYNDTGTAYEYILSEIEMNHKVVKCASSPTDRRWFNMAGNTVFFTYVP